MRHTNFIDKNSSFKIISKLDAVVEVWKFTLTDGLVSMDDVAVEAIGSFFRATIQTPDEDCFILTKHGNDIGICRIGNPAVLVVGYTGKLSEDNPYAQYDIDGAELDSGSMSEIGEGFYYINPLELDIITYFDLDGLIKTLKVPYTTNLKGIGSSGRIHLQENVWQLIAINVRGVKVKEYFLDKLAETTSVATENIVKRVSAYYGDENSFTSFIPASTDPLSSKNFNLVHIDSSSGNDVEEITAFWVKMLDYKMHYNQELFFEWDSADGH